MADVQVELLRRNVLGALVSWLVNEDGTEPVADSIVRERLQALLDRLDRALTVDVTDRPARVLGAVTVPDPVEVADRVGRVLGVVSLDPASLAALEQVSVVNPTADPEIGLAKDATLELVRAQVAAVSANTDTIEQLLTTLRDNQLRRTDPLPAGNNTIGHVLTAFEARTMFTLLSGSRTVGGSSAGLPSSELSRAAVDMQVTAVSGVGPSLRVFVDRMGSDGVWYPIWSSSAMTAVGTLSTTIGQGMTVGQSLAAQVRFRWEISGTSAAFTFSASMVGK
jgi:hypothetical protein